MDLKVCKNCHKQYNYEKERVQHGTQVSDAGYCSLDCLQSRNKNSVIIERKNLDEALNLHDVVKQKCKHNVLIGYHCPHCCSICPEDEDLMSMPEKNVEESKIAWQGMRELQFPKYDNDYWLRRWAGDAMKGMLGDSRYGGEHETYVKESLNMAEALLKAFKEKEKDEGSN